MLGFQLLLLFLRDKSHLLMIWRGEDIFILGLSGEFRWEDLTLNVAIGSYVRDGKGHTLMHHLSIEVFSFDFLLMLS
jgi:hypothetical protein